MIIDDIYIMNSKEFIIEFACFSFHVGLLIIKLSSLKLHTENNACMLCASVRRNYLPVQRYSDNSQNDYSLHGHKYDTIRYDRRV